MKGILALLLAAMAAAAAAAAEEDPCRRACPEMFNPVCSTDGRTLPSPCEFEVYRCEKAAIKVEVTIAHGGECKEVETGCPKVCPSIYAPVCGSDGQTYDNECKLEYASCRAFKEEGVDIHMDHEGPCVAAAAAADDDDVLEECPIFCPSEWAPVCGSNGKTYSNKCRLEVASCRSEQRDGPVIEMIHAGVCKTLKADYAAAAGECMKACPRVLAPVCASDGTTRGNECLFEIYRCEQANDGNEVVLVYDGPCGQRRMDKMSEEESCVRACSKVLKPVCASNGQTFGNRCLFEVFRCLAAKNGDEVVVAHDGPCKKQMLH